LAAIACRNSASNSAAATIEVAERAHEGGVEVTTLYRWARAFRATGLLSPLRVRQSAAWARWLDGARLASAAARAAAAAPQPPRRFYPAGSRLPALAPVQNGKQCTLEKKKTHVPHVAMRVSYREFLHQKQGDPKISRRGRGRHYHRTLWAADT
jgi:hypothetical protein